MTFYGLVSLHPAACVAAARVFGSKALYTTQITVPTLIFADAINAVHLGLIKDHAQSIMVSPPIDYAMSGVLKLHGGLFNLTRGNRWYCLSRGDQLFCRPLRTTGGSVVDARDHGLASW